MEPRWRIWTEQFNEKGEAVGYGLYHKSYKYRKRAETAAEARFGGNPMVKYHVSQTNPWSENK